MWTSLYVNDDLYCNGQDSIVLIVYVGRNIIPAFLKKIIPHGFYYTGFGLKGLTLIVLYIFKAIDVGILLILLNSSTFWESMPPTDHHSIYELGRG